MNNVYTWLIVKNGLENAALYQLWLAACGQQVVLSETVPAAGELIHGQNQVLLVHRRSWGGQAGKIVFLDDADIALLDTPELFCPHVLASAEQPRRTHEGAMIGASQAMQKIYGILHAAARSTAPVLITGESGTGKELAAEALHLSGQRKAGPFEAVNCAALPAALVESEIFGHVRGAFTGAVLPHRGAAARAHGGTLFLDEIGDMPPELQAKLLRFLQTGLFTPVGGEEVQKSDARIVAATNRNPQQAVAQGLLREDLYYRLNVIGIHMPSLRARGGDIALLARHFLKKAAVGEGRDFTHISPQAQMMLANARWPGNVRQMENVIRRAVIMHEGAILQADMLELEAPLCDGSQQEKHLRADFLPLQAAGVRSLEVYERDIILHVLALHGGNVTQAARGLDINPATIYRKLKSWGVMDDSLAV